MDSIQTELERGDRAAAAVIPPFAFSHLPEPSLMQPSIVSAWVLDLDGTIKSSYENLRVVRVLHNTLEKHIEPAQADKFIADLVKDRSFQGVLHASYSTMTAFGDFIKRHDVPIDAKILNETLVAAREIQKNAFKVYGGFHPFMNMARSAEIPVFIYTNSAIGDAGKSLQLSDGGIDPSLFTAIYARCNPDRPAVTKKEWRDATAFAQRAVPYTDYKKPDPFPVLEIAEALDIPVEHVAMLGEGSNDARVALAAGCQFLFHVPGAKDIDVEVCDTNERLRPGAEPLGHHNVMAFLGAQGMRAGEHYHRLENGFVSAIDKVNEGGIIVRRPPFNVELRNGRLVRLNS